MRGSPHISSTRLSSRRALLLWAAIVVAVVVVVGSRLWQRGRAATSTVLVAESPRDSAQIRSSAEVRLESLPTKAPAKMSASPDRSLEETAAGIHAKLRAWSEMNAGETDAQHRLTEEALALLDDRNTAKIVQSLSAEELSTPFGSAALARWLKLAPLSAAHWVGARANTSEEHAMLVAKELAKVPAQLHAYCDQLPEGAWKESLLNSASLTAVSGDPVQAIASAQRMKAGSAQTSAFETVAYDWSSRDPEAALVWMTSVDDQPLRERLFAVGAKAIAATDPDLAVGWLLTGVKSPQLMQDTALCIVETWVAQDPANAARWVSAFPATGPRTSAVEAVARSWMRADARAASSWLMTLPERVQMLAKLDAERIGSPLPADFD